MIHPTLNSCNYSASEVGLILTSLFQLPWKTANLSGAAIPVLSQVKLVDNSPIRFHFLIRWNCN